METKTKVTGLSIVRLDDGVRLSIVYSVSRTNGEYSEIIEQSARKTVVVENAAALESINSLYDYANRIMEG